MSGTTIPLFSRRTFDFDDLGNNGLSEIQIHKAIDVTQYTSGTLEVRVHSKNIGSNGAINVLAYTTGPTAEAPTVDFYVSSPVATVSVVPSGTAPYLQTTALSANFGGMLMITVQGDQPAAAGALTAELSAYLTLKD